MITNIPQSNRKVFAISFIIAVLAILGFIFFVKYNSSQGGPVDREVMRDNPSPTKVFDAPFTEITLYYIDLEKFPGKTPAPVGSTTPVLSDDETIIGCGDGLIGYKIPVGEQNGLTKSDATSFVLRELFNDASFEMFKKDNASADEKADRNPYNALSKSKLTVKSVKEIPGQYEVRLTGTASMAGVCDAPRVLAQIEKTLGQIFAPASVSIFLNDKPLKDALGSN